MGLFTRKKTAGEFLRGALKGDFKTEKIDKATLAKAAGAVLVVSASEILENAQRTTRGGAEETRERGTKK